MLIHEARQACRLTKKAIEYYEEQQLIRPRVLENGYRDYSDEDVERLKQIAVLRKLGMRVPDIRAIFEDDGEAALLDAAGKRALEMETLQEQQVLLQELARTRDWEAVRLRLNALEQKRTILERMLDAFPGAYGRYACWHFSCYLNEPVETKEQQEAFDTILLFLDGVDLQIPDDLREFLDEAMEQLGQKSQAVQVTDQMKRAVAQPEQYLADNRAVLEQYLAMKQSEEYRRSPAFRLQQLLETFTRESGYNEVFLPAMKRLSPSYREYCEAMERANAVFLEAFPDGAASWENKRPPDGKYPSGGEK